MNTIYDGSFVIGQTSATNFIGGTGIKVDSPSEGTVRIANDETVLWSGANASFSVNLNESLYNFKYIGVTVHRFGTLVPTQFFDTDRISAVGGFNTNYISNNSTTDALMFFFTTPYTVYNDGQSISSTISSHGFTYNPTNNAMQGYVKNSTAPIIKVVGINRISGSNA